MATVVSILSALASFVTALVYFSKRFKETPQDKIEDAIKEVREKTDKEKQTGRPEA